MIEVYAAHCSHVPHGSISTKSIAIENGSIAAYKETGQR